MKRGDMGGNPFPLIVDSSQIIIPFSREVNDLYVRLSEKWGATKEKLIDSRSSLTPTHDKECRTLGVEAEGSASIFLSEWNAKIPTHRRPRHDAFPARK